MIYSKDDIRSFYTNQVKKYLEDGYDINIESMNGSQGEDSRIDLVKEGEVIRVIIGKKYVMCLGTIIYIKIIRFEYDGSTLYGNERGHLVNTLNFVKAKDGKNYYMVNKNGLDKILYKMRLRDDFKYDDTGWIDLSSKYYPIFKRIVQSFNIPDWKRFDIKSVFARTDNGKKYYLIRNVNGGSLILRRSETRFHLN